MIHWTSLKLKLILINIFKKINKKITDWGNIFVIIYQEYIRNYKSTIENLIKMDKRLEWAHRKEGVD